MKGRISVATNVGSTCSITTSIDSQIGGSGDGISEQKRAIWQLAPTTTVSNTSGCPSDVRIFDGGSHGAAGTFDNAEFAVGGLFFP
jgi:hypothetical protein